MKKAVLGLLVLCLTLSCFAQYKDVTLKLTLADGKVVEQIVKADDKICYLSTNEIKNIVKIEGLENAKQLEEVKFVMLRNPLDLSVIKELTNLKRLVLLGTKVNDMRFFLDNENLEEIYFDTEVTSEALNDLYTNPLDFSKLTKLNKVTLQIKDLENQKSIKTILPMTNVKNKPFLDYAHNEIEQISKKDGKVLKQFSSLYIWDNPIVNNEKQMKMLKKYIKITEK